MQSQYIVRHPTSVHSTWQSSPAAPPTVVPCASSKLSGMLMLALSEPQTPQHDRIRHVMQTQIHVMNMWCVEKTAGLITICTTVGMVMIVGSDGKN